MTPRSWEELTVQVVQVSAADHWAVVIDYVSGPVTLKICAVGAWSVTGAICSPDGDLHAPQFAAAPPLAVAPPVAEYPVGTLLGKIGGSTSGRKEGKIFAIGESCVYSLSAADNGPLLIAVHADPLSFAPRAFFVQISVSKLLG